MTNKDLQYVITYQYNYLIHNSIAYYTEYIYEGYKILFKSRYTNNKLVDYSIYYYDKSFSMSDCLILSEMYDNVELYNYYDYADL